MALGRCPCACWNVRPCATISLVNVASWDPKNVATNTLHTAWSRPYIRHATNCVGRSRARHVDELASRALSVRPFRDFVTEKHGQRISIRYSVLVALLFLGERYSLGHSSQLAAVGGYSERLRRSITLARDTGRSASKCLFKSPFAPAQSTSTLRRDGSARILQ